MQDLVVTRRSKAEYIEKQPAIYFWSDDAAPGPHFTPYRPRRRPMKAFTPTPRSRHIISSAKRHLDTKYLHSSAPSNLAHVRAFNPSLFFNMLTESQDDTGSPRVGTTISVESMQPGSSSSISGPSGVTAEIGGQANVQRLAKLARDFRSEFAAFCSGTLV